MNQYSLQHSLSNLVTTNNALLQTINRLIQAINVQYEQNRVTAASNMQIDEDVKQFINSQIKEKRDDINIYIKNNQNSFAQGSTIFQLIKNGIKEKYNVTAHLEFFDENALNTKITHALVQYKNTDHQQWLEEYNKSQRTNRQNKLYEQESKENIAPDGIQKKRIQKVEKPKFTIDLYKTIKGFSLEKPEDESQKEKPAVNLFALPEEKRQSRYTKGLKRKVSLYTVKSESDKQPTQPSSQRG